MRNNWFEIWYSCSNLVVFATVGTMSNKKGKKNLVTHNQELKKKIIEGYLHILVGMKHAYLY